MQISEVRIKLMDEPHDRLLAFCSVTFEGCFVIRDLKLIQGRNGLFVAMPSRKLTDRCVSCGVKNHLRALYCNHCGQRLGEQRAARDEEGRSKLYADIAHPIHSDCREHVQAEVLRAFEQERLLASRPGYVCGYDEDDFDDDSPSIPAEDDQQRHMSREPAGVGGSPADEQGCPSYFRAAPEPVSIGANRYVDSPQPLRGVHQPLGREQEASNGYPLDDDEFGAGLL